MTKYLSQCFDMTQIDSNIYLKEYMKIVKYRLDNPSLEKYSEGHHIVPKCWFKIKGVERDDAQNIVILSIREHLKVHVILVYYFASMKDDQMYFKMLNTIHRMTNIGCQQIRRFIELYGDIPNELYREFQKIREEYYKNNRKYTQEYLEECFRIYGSYDDCNEAFQQVVKRMGFKYKRRTLLDQFLKYIPREKYDEVIGRQGEYFRLNCGNVVSKYGSVEQYEIEKQKKIMKKEQERVEKEKRKEKEFNDTAEKLRDMYDCYVKYGVRYMKCKNPSFHTACFLQRCGKYGIIDYKPSRDTKKKEIEYNGEKHGIYEWSRILNMSRGDTSKIITVHTQLGIDYETLLKEYSQGNLSSYTVQRKRKDFKNLSLEQEIDFLTRCSVNLGFDYERICDMHKSGIALDVIRTIINIKRQRVHYELSDEEVMKLIRGYKISESFVSYIM